MEALKKILEKRGIMHLKGGRAVTPTQKSIFSCEKCRDTLFILGENERYKYCSCIEEKRVLKLWENFGVEARDRKKIRDYRVYDDFTNKVKGGAVKYVSEFSHESGSFAVLGQSGSGKSHISIAIGVALIEIGYKVVYMPYIEGMKELKMNAVDESYERIKNRFAMADVLIIDDLFKDKVVGGEVVGRLTEVDMRHFYPILNYRYNNRLPTIFSCECSVSELLMLDEALGGRLVESCGENVFHFSGRDYNYRIRAFQGV